MEPKWRVALADLIAVQGIATEISITARFDSQINAQRGNVVETRRYTFGGAVMLTQSVVGPIVRPELGDVHVFMLLVRVLVTLHIAKGNPCAHSSDTTPTEATVVTTAAATYHRSRPTASNRDELQRPSHRSVHLAPLRFL